MFWFNDRPRHRRYHRGFYGFPWILFAFFWVFPTQFWGHVIFIGLIALAVIWFARRLYSQSWVGNQQAPFSPYQPTGQASYQQPREGQRDMQQPYYQPMPTPERAPYQSYQEGYQVSSFGAAPENADPYRVPQEQEPQEPSQYNQPRAEYPQQMPPM
ncbi:hypothetical protein [Dictyobacter arantiisoli]|uniref:hypothetical protein n=1 Tax=Dictyobacter arantiisoli TaxID=2014874 RepID=UPI0011EFD1A9|nr:hypothetical protein [Dictyobacter arantiisoli]